MKLKNLRKTAVATLVAVSAASATFTPALITGSQSVMAEETGSVIRLNKSAVSMDIDDIEWLRATVTANTIADMIPVWESSDPSVARVTGGFVRALKTGTTVITAKTKDGKNSASCMVTITDDGAPAINIPKIDLTKGKELTINAINKAKELIGVGIKIVSDNPEIIQIKDGVIKAIKEGTATISAVTSDGIKKVIAKVIVTAGNIKENIPVINIDIKDKFLEIKEGLTKKISAIFNPENATDKNLIWISENPNIAKVVDGVVTAIKEGTVKIKAMTPDGKHIAEVTVNVTRASKKNGWVNENGSWYYYSDDTAYTGWHWMTLNEGETTPHWSYFGSDGKLYTGWRWMTQNESESTPHWSYFGANGWLRTGWIRLGVGTSEPDNNNPAHWSYFGANGWLRTDWVYLGAGTSEPDGNTTPHWSYFGPNGWLREGWQEMGAGTTNPDGNNPKHTSYFGNNGWLRVGKQTINGKTYIFNNLGWLQ